MARKRAASLRQRPLSQLCGTIGARWQRGVGPRSCLRKACGRRLRASRGRRSVRPHHCAAGRFPMQFVGRNPREIRNRGLAGIAILDAGASAGLFGVRCRFGRQASRSAQRRWQRLGRVQDQRRRMEFAPILEPPSASLRHCHGSDDWKTRTDGEFQRLRRRALGARGEADGSAGACLAHGILGFRAKRHEGCKSETDRSTRRRATEGESR